MKILILVWKESSRYLRMVVWIELAKFSRLVSKMLRLGICGEEEESQKEEKDRTNDQRNGARGGGTLRKFEVSVHGIVFL
jgi:hypothetical protein